MKTDLLRLLEKYHFLRYEDIEEVADRYIRHGNYQQAKEYLKSVRDIYLENVEQIIKANSFLVIHFERLHSEDAQMALMGKKYPGGSEYKFVYLIEQLIKKTEKKAEKTKEPFTVTQAGYILYFLQSAKAEGFPETKTRDKNGIKEQLKKIGCTDRISHNTVYSKGMIHFKQLNNYKIDMADFAVALTFLEKFNTKAYELAAKEYPYLIADRLDIEG